MTRLRALFLAPTWAVMAVLFLAPLSIVIAYSALTRGAYGGLSLPWTAENYSRIVEPLYLAILLRSFWIAAAATALGLILGFRLALLLSCDPCHTKLYLSL